VATSRFIKGFFLRRYNRSKEVKMATQGYCVKCKAKVDIKDPIESLTSKGTKIAKGKCPKCGTTVCRMGGLK